MRAATPHQFDSAPSTREDVIPNRADGAVRDPTKRMKRHHRLRASSHRVHRMQLQLAAPLMFPPHIPRRTHRKYPLIPPRQQHPFQEPPALIV